MNETNEAAGEENVKNEETATGEAASETETVAGSEQ